MTIQFHDRAEAGRVLAGQLLKFAGTPDVVVVAIPSGGVPVGFEIARALDAPLATIALGKLRAPGCADLSLGAVATGGIVVVNEDIVVELEIPGAIIARMIAAAQADLKRQERLWRQGRLSQELRGRVVILVDDGIATGATMQAALASVRQQGAARIIVAAPVVDASAGLQVTEKADHVVYAMMPDHVSVIADWYQDFTPTTAAEAHGLLDRAAGEQAVLARMAA